jgi:hypothetical protein
MATATEPRRLQRARDVGILNARCANHADLLRAYGLWCWRMSIPMVWYERRTPTSRLSRVHLDMLTTPYRLTVSGHAALIALSAGYIPPQYASITADGAVWDRLSPIHAAGFAHAVFRAVRRPASYQFLTIPVQPPSYAENVVPFKPAVALPA